MRNNIQRFPENKPATTIQKHIRGFLTRKILKNLKTKENLINMNKLPRGNVVRIRRAPGMYNYVSKNTLKSYFNFKGVPLKTNIGNENTGVLHPLTRTSLRPKNMKTIYNPYR